MNEEIELIFSPLCQTIERDGESVRVDIYGNGENGWLLEVVDEFGNSVVWDDHFPTDQEALDEVLDTIEKEGINALIGQEESDQVH